MSFFKRIIGLFFLLTISMACRHTGPDQPAFDTEQIKSEVSRMLHQYHEDIEADGIIAEFDYLDSSDLFFWVPPGYDSALDYDSVKTILLKNNKNFKDILFDWKSLNIYPLSSDICNYNGIVAASMSDTSGNRINYNLIESGTIAMRDGKWKLLCGQSAILK